GGGTLLDVGFYPITMSRFCFDAEPTRVVAALERDPESGVDRLVSAILQFPGGQATFTCGMQLPASQYAALLGTKGRIEMNIPWTPPPDQPSRLSVDRGAELESPEVETITFDPCNQYTILAETFAQSIRAGAPAAVP